MGNGLTLHKHVLMYMHSICTAFSASANGLISGREKTRLVARSMLGLVTCASKGSERTWFDELRIRYDPVARENILFTTITA